MMSHKKKHKGGRAFRGQSPSDGSRNVRAPLRRSRKTVCGYPPTSACRAVPRLVALRGAAQAENTASDIAAQTAALYAEILDKNDLAETDIVSVIFSLTPDLDAQNPAAALRKAGFAAQTPLFALQEAFIQGGMPRVIRVLIHCFLPASVPPRHIFRNGAEALRPDWALPNTAAEASLDKSIFLQ